LRQELQHQQERSSTADTAPQASPLTEQRDPTAVTPTSTPAAVTLSPASTAASPSAPSSDGERGRLIAELTELRAQVAHLQSLTAAGLSGSVGLSLLRRDSGVHWANVVTAIRLEGEKVAVEKEEKIQSLLSAQRVLAESREVKTQQLMREWREREKEWNVERERLKEEARRLRKRLNRLSLESQSKRGSLLPQSLAQRVGAEEPLRSTANSVSSDSSDSSDESSMDPSPRFHHVPGLSSTQPLPSSAAPPLPHKPPHSLGLVIAARIAAFEARRGEDSEVIREKMGISQRSRVQSELLSKKRSNTVMEEEKEKASD
jgi:hypothetical protein